MVKSNIAFLINSMAGGGAERVLSILLKQMPRNGRQFFLITLDDKFYYEIPEDVIIIKLNNNLNNNFKKLLAIFLGAKKLKKIIKENNIDTVFSFLGRSNYINVLSKMLGSNHKVYIGERVDPSQMHSAKNVIAIFNKLLTSVLYKKADVITTNSFGTKTSLVKDFSISPEKITVIYNPIDLTAIKKLSEEVLEMQYQSIFNNPVIINVARLEKQKDQEHLIRAFKKVKGEIKSAKLVILGEGELENPLKELAKELGLENDIYFIGWQKNPFKFLAKSKMFVLSSLWEGFPNTLIEAMALGLPVISTDCPSGPNEVIENGKNGLLVPVKDENKLAEAMIKVLKDSNLATQLGNNAKTRANDFDMAKIMGEYEEILN